MSKFAKSRYNPFDKFAQGAKIPDGKSNQSIGVRSTTAFELTLPESGSVMDFVIAPGLHQPLLPVVGTGTAPVIAPGSTFGEIANLTYAGTEFTPQDLTTFPHKWRLVSAGIRFVLLNNSDENEGWWEAVRVSDDIDPDDANQTLNTGSTGTSDPMVGVAFPYIKSKSDPTKQAVITSDNTYIAGRFKDMHQVTFKLNSISSEHNFVEIDGVAVAQSVKKLFDPSYDSINLRFHPRTSGGDLSKASKFVVHASYNYEIEYEPGTLLAKMASAGWGGSKARSSRGDTMTPGVVTRSFGMKRKKGATVRRSYKKKKTTTRKRPTYTKKARRKTTKKYKGRK